MWDAFVWWSFVFGIYAKTASPSVSGGDSGELLAVACSFGIAHPPGYPLYTLLLRMAMEMGQLFGSPSFAQSGNLLNALLSSLTSVWLYCVMKRMVRWFCPTLQKSKTRCIAVLVSALFSFHRVVWYNAGISEVFALNNLFCVGLLYFGTCFFSSRQVRFVWMAAFWCGLGLSNQHTFVLFVIPVVLIVVAALVRQQQLNLSLTIKTILCFALGLLPHIYLVVSYKFSTSLFIWGAFDDTKGFLHHLLRSDYGTFELVTPNSTSSSHDNSKTPMIMFASMFFANAVLWIGVLFVIIGVLYMIQYKDERRWWTVALCAMFVGYTCFFCWRGNIDLKTMPLYTHIFERFWMQPLLPFLIIFGVGIGAIVRRHVSLAWLVLIVIITGCAVFTWNHRYCDQSDLFLFEDMGREILGRHGLSHKQMLLVHGDATMGSAFYLASCYPDEYRNVTVVAPSMLTFPWFEQSRLKANLRDRGIRFPTQPNKQRWDVHQEGEGFSMSEFIWENGMYHIITAYPYLTERPQPLQEQIWSSWVFKHSIPNSIVHWYAPHSLDHRNWLKTTRQEWMTNGSPISRIRWPAMSSPKDRFPIGSWERFVLLQMIHSQHDTFCFCLIKSLETFDVQSAQDLQLKFDLLRMIVAFLHHLLEQNYFDTELAPRIVGQDNMQDIMRFTRGKAAWMLLQMLPDDEVSQESVSLQTTLQVSWLPLLTKPFFKSHVSFMMEGMMQMRVVSLDGQNFLNK